MNGVLVCGVVVMGIGKETNGEEDLLGPFTLCVRALFFFPTDHFMDG
jgi:hypothetical protein